MRIYSKNFVKKDWIDGTTFYYLKKENVIIRFDRAEYLLWEQRHKNQTGYEKENLK